MMVASISFISDIIWHWCTNRHFDKNIEGLLFFHDFHLKIWLSWHLAQQGIGAQIDILIKIL